MSAFPESIKHDDFIAAIRPLLTLCGTTPEATHIGLTITQGEHFPEVMFLSVVNPHDGTIPIEVGEDEFAEYSWPVVVAVV